jgi:hypothetical protein
MITNTCLYNNHAKEGIDKHTLQMSTLPKKPAREENWSVTVIYRYRYKLVLKSILTTEVVLVVQFNKKNIINLQRNT